MSQRTIKAAVQRLMEENLDLSTTTVFERYPRYIDNSKGRVVVLWCRRAREKRFAGSGRSAGPIHGVKTVPWVLDVHVTQWGQAVEADYNDFEDFVDTLLELFRMNSVLPNAVDEANGSQVLNFGEEMDIENIVPEIRQQFVKFQMIVSVKVEEIYNA